MVSVNMSGVLCFFFPIRMKSVKSSIKLKIIPKLKKKEIKEGFTPDRFPLLTEITRKL